MAERYCKICKGWHDLEASWPLNCLPERNWSQSDFPAPQITKPMPDYRSPVDGRLITSRHARREDLKRNGCVEWEPGIGKGQYARRPGEIHNPEYLRGNPGFRLSEKGEKRADMMRKGATKADIAAEENRGKRKGIAEIKADINKGIY